MTGTGAPRLRLWRAADLDAVVVMAEDPHVGRWSALAEDPAAWLAGEIASDQLTRAICAPGDDRALGRIAVRFPAAASGAVRCAAVRAADQPAGELSYWLVPDARGRGLALGAVRAMRALVAATTDLHTLVLDIETTNAASAALAARAGAERREPERIVTDRRGEPRTLAVWVLEVAA